MEAPLYAQGDFVSYRFDELRSGPSDAVLAEGASSKLIVGDASDVLAWLPANTIQTCVTSPPYWHVRDYGIQGQLGLEVELQQYIVNLVDVFAGVRRVLCEDGTLWLNLGDGYTSGGRRTRAPDRKNPNRAMDTRPPTPPLLKPKDLLGVPWRLAQALQLPQFACPSCTIETHASRWGSLPDGRPVCPSCLKPGTPEIAREGWYLRSEIIWERPNCQPESVRDRPTRAHEHLFLFSKSTRYHYDSQAERGPNNRNLRTVWQIPTQPGRHGHIAPFPEALAERCLRLTSRLGTLVLDPFLGSATTAVAATCLQRPWIGIELNPAYARQAERRLLALAD